MKKFIIFLLLSISLLYLYGKYIEPENFIVREYSIVDSKIPEEFDGYKIIHFSDLYYDNRDLSSIINKINRLKPDLVVFTGDLIKNYYNKDKLIDYLSKIDSKNDIYFVRGDNDYNETYEDIISKINGYILNNEFKYIYNNGLNKIVLSGLDNEVNIDDAFNFEEGIYSITLSHKPDNYDLLNNKHTDLYLTGHSLNGQIRLPFAGAIIKVNGAMRYYDPVYSVNNSKIYISNGLGNPKYNFRLFNTPSINFYRLYNK